MRGGLRAAALVLGLLPVPALAGACALELILAVDVSGSIDSREFALQTNGLADAFENPSLVAAIGEIDGGPSQGAPVRVWAPQRGAAFAMSSAFSQSGARSPLSLFIAAPAFVPPARRLYGAGDDGLSTIGHLDVLHRHDLPPAAAHLVQRRHAVLEAGH